jgi:hypothetical protein
MSIPDCPAKVDKNDVFPDFASSTTNVVFAVYVLGEYMAMIRLRKVKM